MQAIPAGSHSHQPDKVKVSVRVVSCPVPAPSVTVSGTCAPISGSMPKRDKMLVSQASSFVPSAGRRPVSGWQKEPLACTASM